MIQSIPCPNCSEEKGYIMALFHTMVNPSLEPIPGDPTDDQKVFFQCLACSAGLDQDDLGVEIPLGNVGFASKKQEILDLFAQYGSGNYIPTEQEKAIIDSALDNILGGPHGA